MNLLLTDCITRGKSGSVNKDRDCDNTNNTNNTIVRIGCMLWDCNRVTEILGFE